MTKGAKYFIMWALERRYHPAYERLCISDGENRMTKKHQAELTAVAEKIYDLAANEIQDYINKIYGKNQENTLAQQLEDFHVIADTVASYLMGNAMAMVDKSCWNDDLKTLNGHIRQIAEYVASNQQAELGPKN